jgi:hypothetical protein
MDEFKNEKVSTTETRLDKGQVASTFIKYAAYVIIFFGFLYFVVRFVFPAFN